MHENVKFHVFQGIATFHGIQGFPCPVQTLETKHSKI